MTQSRDLDGSCHVVTTEDGYKLKIFRVNDNKIGNKGKKPVVFLQHGLLCSADNWVSNDDLSPAIILARAGFDVWLGNARGTKYSRDHETLNPDRDAEFWEFSFQQMGYFDLPAVFDYIHSMTNG